MGPATDNLYAVQATKALELDRRVALRKWAQLLRETAPIDQSVTGDVQRRRWLPIGARRPAAR